MSSLDNAAEVPAHKDPAKKPDDLVALNKVLRACFVCRLVKSDRQFLERGCDNCNYLELEDDRGKVNDYTTPHFTGVISVMQPPSSWAAKWLHLGAYVPGCYALAIQEDMPDSLRDYLDNRGIKWHQPD